MSCIIPIIRSVLFIYNNKDEILMLRSKRYTAGGLEWEIPAGRVEKMNPPEGRSAKGMHGRDGL